MCAHAWVTRGLFFLWALLCCPWVTAEAAMPCKVNAVGLCRCPWWQSWQARCWLRLPLGAVVCGIYPEVKRHSFLGSGASPEEFSRVASCCPGPGLCPPALSTRRCLGEGSRDWPTLQTPSAGLRDATSSWRG